MSLFAPALRRFCCRPSSFQQQPWTTSKSFPRRALSSYSDTRVLPYTQRELYRVVADIDAYKTFIPFVLDSKVLHQAPNAPKTWLDGPEGETVTLESELNIGFAGWSERYISKNTFEKFHTVKVCLLRS